MPTLRTLSVLPLIALALLAAHAHAAGLNDTGVTFCGDDSTNTANCAVVGADGGTHPRQDGNFVKPFNFTKIANNGSTLPASAALGTGATDWACTKDNVTGLVWEVKTTNGLRSQYHTYTWYNSNPATNGGDNGTVSGGTCFTAGRCDTEKFVADVNAAGLCGATDWRMPKIKELEGIVDFGVSHPAIDPTYFPNTSVSDVWSGSPNADNASSVWFVSFGSGFSDDGSDSRPYNGGVRLVRGGQ